MGQPSTIPPSMDFTSVEQELTPGVALPVYLGITRRNGLLIYQRAVTNGKRSDKP